MQTKAISIILPFYNAEHTLERAIESIYRQTFEDFECILVDNNSTDNSESIAKEWVAKDTRFRLIKEDRQGVVFASNAAASKATGKYVARMDADDYAFPERLLRSFEFLEANDDFGAVAGTVQYMSHKENTEGFERYVHWSNSVLSYQQIRLKQFIEAPLVNPTVMWRRELGTSVGLYKNGEFPEDYEMWLRWIEAGIKIEKLDVDFIKWYDSDTRLTRTNSMYSDDAFFKIKSEYLFRWLENNNPHHPDVMVWGASKTSRQRVAFLKKFGVEVSAYIDIKRTRQLDAPICYYEDIPQSEKAFILVYIKPADHRDEIEVFLRSKGYVEGGGFLFVS